jgi:hypothetical protein
MTPDEFAALSDDEKFQILDDESDPRYEAVLDYLSPESEVNAPSADAPYGWMNDPITGERRPKKRPGRQRTTAVAADSKPPASDAAPEASVSRVPLERSEDRAPSGRSGRGGGRGSKHGSRSEVPRETVEATPFRAGPIAKGMNKLYRRVGKLVSMADPMTGQAFVDITRKDDEDDVTVGEAWEELARVNPRIRAALNKLLTGSGWGQLVMCHMPILLAVAIRTGVLERLNLSGLAGMVSDSDDPEPDNPFDGLSREDWEQAASLAAQMMPGAVAPPFSRGV